MFPSAHLKPLAIAKPHRAQCTLLLARMHLLKMKLATVDRGGKKGKVKDKENIILLQYRSLPLSGGNRNLSKIGSSENTERIPHVLPHHPPPPQGKG